MGLNTVSVEQYLISIKPVFAYRLFAGLKMFELRKVLRCIPKPGSIMVVYASYPIQALIGEFIAEDIEIGEPRVLMEYIRGFTGSGVGEEDFKYIEGAERAMAIKVSKPTLYRRFVRLRELERVIPGFKPPYSMRRVEEGEPLNELVLRKLREYTFKLSES